MARRLAPILLVALIAAACSGGEAADTSTTTTTPPPTTTTTAATTTSSSTTSTSTTTTTVPVITAPLNGLPVDDAADLERRVIAIKMDNHPNARPQSGLQEADAVYELRVEGGFTRFIALFHQTDSGYVGPIRSGRPTDPELVIYLGATFMTAGANYWVTPLIRSLGTNYLSNETLGTRRISSRRAPHNLYGDTTQMRDIADEPPYEFPDDPPPEIFAFADIVLDGEDATEVTLDWASGHTVTWEWDGSQYLRYEGSTAHSWLGIDGDSDQVAFDTLVVIEGPYYLAAPPNNGEGALLPSIDTIGSGEVHVFAQGKVVSGTWNRAAIDLPFQLVAEDGGVLQVPPGRPWISVFPENRDVTWSTG